MADIRIGVRLIGKIRPEPAHLAPRPGMGEQGLQQQADDRQTACY